MKRFVQMLVLLLLLTSNRAQAQKYESYLKASELPDATHFLPPPPGPDSPAFKEDVAAYFFSRDNLRKGERGRRAAREATTNVDTMAKLFSGAFGRELSKERTPRTMHLLQRSIRTFRLSASAPKKAYMRTRPFVYYNEGTLVPEDEAHERGTGSYPSGHTVRGWGMALVLSALNPERQDTILAAGYEWGQSRVIAGYHWQSDVEASRSLAAACFARLQTSAQFVKDIEAAREELGIFGVKEDNEDVDKPYLSREEVRNSLRLLPPPPEEGSIEFLMDKIAYWEYYRLRSTDTARVRQAVKDADMSDTVLLTFEDAFGLRITKEAMPETYRLLRRSMECFGSSGCDEAKAFYKRTRPFVYFNTHTLTPDDEVWLKTNYSYPSGHTANYFGLAYILTELRPECREALQRRAREGGISRVIVGAHWASDVAAGQVVAASVFEYLKKNPQYQAQFFKAKAEVDALCR